MVHGLNEGHIAPYTDIDFKLVRDTKIVSFEIKWKNISLDYGYQNINWNMVNDLQGNI